MLLALWRRRGRLPVAHNECQKNKQVVWTGATVAACVVRFVLFVHM